MSGSIEAVVPTANASRYLQQLCKHWSHKMQVSFTATEGTIAFPNGTVATLQAAPDVLRIRLDVPPAEDSALMAGVVAEHLDRFAFREAPLSFHWRAL